MVTNLEVKITLKGLADPDNSIFLEYDFKYTGGGLLWSGNFQSMIKVPNERNSRHTLGGDMVEYMWQGNG